MIAEMRLAAAGAQRLVLDPGVLQWIGTGIWGVAVLLVLRGLTARSRVQKELTDQRAESLTLLQSDHLQVVMAEVVRFVVAEMNQMVGRSRQERADRVPVFLLHADLGAQRRRLLEIGEDAKRFDRLQSEIVDAAHRTGWAATLFLLPWGYLIFWGSQKGLDLPVWLTATAWGLAAAAVGHGMATAWAERSASSEFAALQRRYEAGVT